MMMMMNEDDVSVTFVVAILCDEHTRCSALLMDWSGQARDKQGRHIEANWPSCANSCAASCMSDYCSGYSCLEQFNRMSFKR
jgi:hypothetical protein